MARLLVTLIASCLLFASCAQGVPVPSDFPVQITLPPGSEISNNPAGDIAEKAAAGMNMKVVNFTCSGGSAKVQKHITAQLKSKGYEKMVIPGLGNASGNDSFSKEGSNIMISFSAVSDDSFMLMTMEMPDMSSFHP